MKFGYHSKIHSSFDFVSRNYYLSNRYENFSCQVVELDIFNKQGFVIACQEYGVNKKAVRKANKEYYAFSDRCMVDQE